MAYTGYITTVWIEKQFGIGLKGMSEEENASALTWLQGELAGKVLVGHGDGGPEETCTVADVLRWFSERRCGGNLPTRIDKRVVGNASGQRVEYHAGWMESAASVRIVSDE